MAKKLYYGGYGHHPSGKQYVYLGDDKYRVGQNVVVPVRQWQSGKLYNTMFTIQRSASVEKESAINEMQRLTTGGTSIKFIEDSNVMTLPGASDWKSAKEWKEWSNLVYEEKIANRLRESSNKVTTQLTNRQLEEYKPEVALKDLLKPQRTKKPKQEKEPTIKIPTAQSSSFTPQKDNSTTTQADKIKARLKGYATTKSTEAVKNRLLGY